MGSMNADLVYRGPSPLSPRVPVPTGPYRPDPPRTTVIVASPFSDKEVEALKRIASDEITHVEAQEEKRLLERLADKLGFDLVPLDSAPQG